MKLNHVTVSDDAFLKVLREIVEEVGLAITSGGACDDVMDRRTRIPKSCGIIVGRHETVLDDVVFKGFERMA